MRTMHMRQSGMLGATLGQKLRLAAVDRILLTFIGGLWLSALTLIAIASRTLV